MKDEIIVNGRMVKIISQIGNFRICLLVDENREFYVPISVLQRFFKKPHLNQSVIQEFIDGKGVNYLAAQKEVMLIKIHYSGKNKDQ